MNTYILFLNGIFDSQKTLEKFTNEFIKKVSKNITAPKFIIENNYNIIVIFNTELDDENTTIFIKENINSELINFFFLFNRENLLIANIPKEISNLIFKELPSDTSLEINFIDEDIPHEEEKHEDEEVDYEEIIDVLLDKIDKFGIDSLTKKEKKLLDNFKK